LVSSILFISASPAGRLGHHSQGAACYYFSLFYYTSIDAPEDDSIVRSFIEDTGDQVYIRSHSKYRENWFKRDITAAERFKYLYSERELQSLAKGFGNLAQQGVKRA
jgi:hypothetical protein